LHFRVSFELTNAAGIEQYRAFAREAAQLCTHKNRASLSGEHGAAWTMSGGAGTRQR